MAFAVGIDLGTTNTVVGAVRDGVVSPLSPPGGDALLPSVVSFHPSGSVLVGQEAVERRLMDAPNTVYSVKRLIGRPWSSPEVQQARAKLPFELREGAKGATVVVTRADTFGLPEISAFVLRQAKALAEATLGHPVDRAVITVPANFNDLQRGATKTAGRLAGLDVLRILNEPTAAALAYGTSGVDRERVGVYDLGGGTFDVTILDLAGNVFEVLATGGDSALGGDDIDVVVAERMADQLLKQHRFDARSHPASFARLRILGEQMKRGLSARDEHEVVADDLVPGERGKLVPWRFRMTRPELEWASLPIVDRTFTVCKQALEAASLAATGLDRVILVGGSTRMPMVARKVEQFFGRPPVMRINPDEVVALGAAIQAALLDRARSRTPSPPVTPRIAETSVIEPLPLEETGGPAPDLPLVQATGKARPAPSPRPPEPEAARREAEARTRTPDPPAARAEAPKRAKPPDLPPARTQGLAGNAGQTGSGGSSTPRRPPNVDSGPHSQFLSGAARPLVFEVPTERPPLEFAKTVAAFTPAPSAAPAPAPPAAPRPAPLLIDVTPLSLSVETVGGFADVLIDANSPVPCDRTRSFSTASDGQITVVVRIAQGESKKFGENTLLGELELTGLDPMPRGQPEIGVTFEIDVDGILNVRARENKSGREMAARMQLVGAQTDAAEIEAMKSRQAAHPVAPAPSGKAGKGRR